MSKLSDVLLIEPGRKPIVYTVYIFARHIKITTDNQLFTDSMITFVNDVKLLTTELR